MFVRLKQRSHCFTERVIVCYISPSHDPAPVAWDVFDVPGGARPPLVSVYDDQQFVIRRQLLRQTLQSSTAKRSCRICSPFRFHEQLVSTMPDEEIGNVVPAG